MTLTPHDIQTQEFKTQLRGYDKNEVDHFLEQIIQDYSEELKTNHRLEYDLKDSKAQIAYFNDLQNTVNESIIIAQNAADQVKKQADEQAQTVIAQARTNTENMVDQAIQQSRQIIQDAQTQAQNLVTQTQTLQKQMAESYQALQQIVDEQQQLLSSQSWQGLLTADDNQTLVENIHTTVQNYLNKLDQVAAEIKNDDYDDLVPKKDSTKVVDKANDNVDNQ